MDILHAYHVRTHHDVAVAVRSKDLTGHERAPGIELERRLDNERYLMEGE